MTRIAFFAHDENDAAIRRRVFAFEDAGYEVAGFAMRRSSSRTDLGWNKVDLGRTHDARFLHRAGAIVSGARKVAGDKALLQSCDLVYARNLDMALCALMAMRLSGFSLPLVYECLDVHRLMHRNTLSGTFLRAAERGVLKRSALLVVSSPGFIREYFDSRHPGKFRAHLIENRIADAPALGPRPHTPARAAGPLRIGWFGVLRCRRSLELLESLAGRFGPEIEIELRGYPDLMLHDFHERIRQYSSMRYRGRYRSPEDLGEMYQGVDLVWAGDFHDAGANSRWLLPNRLYEGGYFGAPAIAPADTETARWITSSGAGFVVNEPLHDNLQTLVSQLVAAPHLILDAQQRLLSLPRTRFIQPSMEMREVVISALASASISKRSDSSPTVAIVSSEG